MMTDNQHAFNRLVMESTGCFECGNVIVKPGRNRPTYGCQLGGQGCEKLRRYARVAGEVVRQLAAEKPTP